MNNMTTIQKIKAITSSLQKSINEMENKVSVSCYDDDDEFKEEREEYEREIAYVKMMKDEKENNKKKWLCLNGRFRS